MSGHDSEALVKACESGNLPAVTRLLQDGLSPTDPVADLSSPYCNWLPLHTAIYNAKGGDEVVKFLLSQPGVDVNQATINPQRTTPLHVAAWHCPSLVPLLLEHGAAVNAKDGYGQTALHDAAFHGHADAVAALLHAGADASIRNKRGLTALDRARSKGRSACVRLLLAKEV